MTQARRGGDTIKFAILIKRGGEFTTNRLPAGRQKSELTYSADHFRLGKVPLYGGNKDRVGIFPEGV